MLIQPMSYESKSGRNKGNKGTFVIASVRKMVYTKRKENHNIGKTVERRRRKATRACTVRMAASCETETPYAS